VYGSARGERSPTYAAAQLLCSICLFDGQPFGIFDQSGRSNLSQELGMGTTEWIASGLLLVALIGWYQWPGTPSQKR